MFANTTLLSTFDKAEKRAFLQEVLDQSAIMRAISCKHNGITGPFLPNAIKEQAAADCPEPIAGISSEEVQRREELVRRETLADLQAQAAQQLQETLTAASQNTASPAGSAQAATSTTPWLPNPLCVLTAAGLLALAGYTSAIHFGPPPVDTPTVPTVAVPAPTAPVATEPPTQIDTPEPVGTTAPNTAPSNTTIITDERDTLLYLQQKGLAAPRTPLGSKILEAFELNPALREKVMRDVENTLMDPRK